jgi:formylglycine-generating enzyme required for sulfatase activity
MGDFTGQDSDALPTVSANVSTFMMSKREISQYTWFTVMGTNPSYYSGDMLPVDQVTWYDAIAFCNKLSSREGKTPCYSINGNTAPADWTSGTITMSKTGGYRLPTEAEWEYAAREQGKTIRYAGTDDSASVSSYAWTVENSGQTIHNTGTKSPNALGLYDMSGNVIEWCWNKYEAYTYTSVNYPSAPSSSYDSVVMRGGSFEGVVTDCKVTKRYAYNPLSTDSQRGFRIVQDWVWDF